MDFWKHLKKIFSNSDKSDALSCGAQENRETRQLSHTALQRSEQEQDSYHEWLCSQNRHAMLEWINKSYEDFSNCCSSYDHALDFLMIPTVNGFVIHYDAQRWDSDHFVCFFDYLSTRVKELGYYCQVADVKSISRGGKVETTQRYFLKPPRQRHLPKHSEEKLDQQYGNIMITLCLVNERIVNLKFSATHYCDRAYKEPKSFHELLNHVCNTSE